MNTFSLGFLKKFDKRMKHVALYAMLMKNILSKKDDWGKYGVNDGDLRINLVFSLMLFLMELSLKEENCTMDDVAAFLDGLNSSYLHKPWGFDECKGLGSFLVNDVLSNNGVMMSFKACGFGSGEEQEVPVRYITNKVIYLKGDVKRTSYALSDDGYNLILSTLEIESNLRLSVQEILFQMHLDRQSYDMALDDIKDIFNRIRIHIQHLKEAMLRIRRNALNYSVSEYKDALRDDLELIRDTREKFENYQKQVEKRRFELEQIHVNLRELRKEEMENLANLKEISLYLTRTLDEHQKVLNTHFDLKDLYSKELESLADVSGVKRFSLRTEVYDPIMKSPDLLMNLGTFLSPLFNSGIGKSYNLKKALSYQRIERAGEEEDEIQEVDFDEAAFKEEQKRKLREKRLNLQRVLRVILGELISRGSVTLSELRDKGSPDLVPGIDSFKEVILEFLRAREIDIGKIRAERSEALIDTAESAELSVMLLELLDSMDPDERLKKIRALRSPEEDERIVFRDILGEDGRMKSIRCSNILFSAEIDGGIK